MGRSLYTAPGCSRCRIVKKYMEKRDLAYRELDIKGDGKDDFTRFYRENRSAVFRGKEGVEFPILVDGERTRQGIGPSIAFLQSNAGLDAFIGRSELSHGWMDGIHVSEGDPALVEELITVLEFVRKNGIKLQLDTSGLNPGLLERLLAHGLGDRVIMEVPGPLSLYGRILNREVDPEDIRRSIATVTHFSEYRFQTTITPFVRKEGDPPEIDFLTPEEIKETAALIQEVTGSLKQPYALRVHEPGAAPDERLKGVTPLSANDLLRHRSAARKHLVLAEIEG